MPKIIQLSSHIANLIAAGEVVERPASVAKELLENAVDAGAKHVTLEIRSGGMTFLRVTDDGCGMTAEDAAAAFGRHATSKLRCAEDLAAIATMGFRGEALAAIASVSRIDLMTKTADSLCGTCLQLEAGQILSQEETGCPDGTTIIIRDLFFNTPARMKFMRSDPVEGGKVSEAVQLQALAHPEVAFTFIRDGKTVLQTPGSGELGAAAYCVYGRDAAQMISVDAKWEDCRIRGFVSKPTQCRPSRSMQTWFVNSRPVKSALLIRALEEAYRNQLMVGKFPACVLHVTLPANRVDVNVHPAKTEVKFLSEKTVFDCVHYGVLGALNRTPDRPQVQLPQRAVEKPAEKPVVKPAQTAAAKPKQDFFRTMSAEEFRSFSGALASAPEPRPEAAARTLQKMEQELPKPIQGTVLKLHQPPVGASKPRPEPVQEQTVPEQPVQEQLAVPEPAQQELPMPKQIPWRLVGELYRSYVLVEQGEEAYLIDKHAAHERILFDRLRENPDAIRSQTLLAPLPVRLRPARAAALIGAGQLLEELGFECEEFGEDTVLVRRVPMDLEEGQIADTLLQLADDLAARGTADRTAARDELLHTVACKAAIKAGWHTDEKELLALVEQVMAREDLKYCPHGRPICITLSKKTLEKQFGRT